MLTELLRETLRTENLRYFDMSNAKFKQTRMIFVILLSLIAVMVSFFFKDPLAYLSIPVAAFAGYKYPYYALLSKRARYDALNAFIFPEFLTTFIALIPTTGNVYQTMEACIPYTKEPLQLKLIDLVDAIQGDNDRRHYLEFAEYIGTSEAYMIIDMIYQFSEFGTKKESLKELENYVHDLQENKIDELIERKMQGMDFLGFSPIFISMFLIFGFAGVLLYHYFKDAMTVVNL